MPKYLRGAEWRRWDLHIHTPETNKNDQFQGNNPAEKWEKFYQDIRNYIGEGTDANKSIAAIGITDYLSIDNYKKVLSDNKLPHSIKLILPNVEMRMTPIAKSSPINIHFIVNPNIVDELDDLLFSQLKINYKYEDYFATKNSLIRLGRAYKCDPQLHERTAYKVGVEQFVINETILQDVLKHKRLKENILIIVSNKSTDGASGLNHKDYFENGSSQLDVTRHCIYQTADIIFSSSDEDRTYFLGKRSDSPEEVIRKCGGLMPCIHGSDAHTNSKIFEPDNKRYCWIKADPTFEGLKQVLYEPEQRIRISELKPETKQGYNVIDRVEFQDSDFQIEPIYFNENLNCIIGGKSTGKSILIQNLARIIDESQTIKHLGTSKRQTKSDVNLKVFWKNGKDDNHKIIYIPQTYLNQLSDEKENQTEIDEWVEEILLKNSNINKSKSQLISYISEYKIDINKKLLDFLRIDEEFKKLSSEKLEIGNKSGILSEIENLTIEKEKIVAQSELSEDDIKSFDNANTQVASISRQKNTLMDDKVNLDLIENLVAESAIKVSFSKETNDKILECREQILSIAKEKWLDAKTSMIEAIDMQLSKLNQDEVPFSDTVSKLKDNIESNEAVKLLTQKISAENIKLVQIEDIEKTEKAILEQRNYLLDKLSKTGRKYKNIYQTYSVIINNNTKETDGLLFQGETPFKSEMFIDKLLSIYLTRRTEFKSIIDIDNFDEAKYDGVFLKTIIEKTIDNTLVLKAGYKVESALREILDDWYNIVYRVRMDNDEIDKMSPGKKALVLLKILISLAESKCPILIDQPEDDLDNRSIFTNLINFIKDKKIDRQIILVTHNANIVLGSDSENIIIANQMGNDSPNKSKRFEYRSGSIENYNIIYKSDGITKETGVLNQRGIQQHICDILEGGEVAFEIRKKKYRI